MMKTRRIPLGWVAASFAALILPFSCRSVNEPVPDDTPYYEQKVEIKAFLEPGSKTTLSGLDVLWASGDQIKVYNSGNTSGKLFTLKSESIGQQEGTFTGSDPGSAPYYAIYPASDGGTLSGTTLGVTLPSTQSYVAGSFASGSFPAVAAGSDLDHMDFKNLCGVLRVLLRGSTSVTRIELTTLGDEFLWGSGTVAMTYGDAAPVLEFAGVPDAAHKTLTLNLPAPVALSSGSDAEFHIVVPAGTLASGFSLKVYDSDFGSMTKTSATDGSNEVRRSSLRPMPSLNYVQTENPFMNLTVFGVYDISSAVPSGQLTYVPGDHQYVYRTTPTSHSFRLQDFAAGKALTVEVPSAALTVGSDYTLTVSSIGTTGIPDSSPVVNLVRCEGGVAWFKDNVNKVGYIIAVD